MTASRLLPWPTPCLSSATQPSAPLALAEHNRRLLRCRSGQFEIRFFCFLSLYYNTLRAIRLIIIGLLQNQHGCESGLNTVLVCFSKQLLCCVLKRSSSACALCVAWFVCWLRHDEGDAGCYCKYFTFTLYQRFIHDKTQRTCEFLGISHSLRLRIFNEHLYEGLFKLFSINCIKKAR